MAAEEPRASWPGGARKEEVLPPGGEARNAVRAFGKYFLVRKLAEGGMAEIFLAKQVGAEGFERNVVIKRMLSHLSAVPDFVGMFLDEARLAARLAHQNIIQINDLGQADGCYYICMEYVPGEDFSTIIRTAGRRREYLPVHVVLRVIAEAAHGLHFAHEFTDDQGLPLNIVHRDISPSNIYVSYSGQVKLLDFGIAKAESRVTNTTAGVVKGKYMYMAPEQARGEAVDRRSDVFSLGVSLYEGLTNVRPFARENDLAILHAVLNCEPKRPREVRPDLPPELERIVLKAMAAKREDRYRSAWAMAAEIEAYLAELISESKAPATLATYLRALFGEERFHNKSRIPTLASLAASGVDVPGFTNPTIPRTEPHSPGVNDRTKVARGTGESNAVSRAPRGAVLAGALGGVLLLAGGGYLGYGLLTEQPPAPPAPLSVADAGASVVVLAPEADAGAPPPAERDAGTLARPAAPVLLTPAVITRVVKLNQVQVMSCFQQHREELKADRGTVNVAFRILRSGQVSEARAELGGRVGACLEARVKALKFPRHRDAEVSLTLPLIYELKR